MNRRLLLRVLAASVCAPAFAQGEPTGPRYKISAEQLYKALSTRFPARYDLAGLLQVQVDAPRLLLLAARNRLGATLQALATGPALHQPRPGELDLLFRLRYERRDRTLRANDPEIMDLRLPGISSDALRTVQGLLGAAARESLGDVVLHRFSDRDLALADTMGFEPDQVTVQDDGLLVTFGPKGPR